MEKMFSYIDQKKARLAGALALVATIVTIAAGTPAQGGAKTTFAFTLSGAQVPGGGDPDGEGHAVLRLDPDEEIVCFKVVWSQLAGEVTAMHIHVAPAGQIGGHHIDLFNAEHFVGEQNRVDACVQVQSHDPSHTPRELIEEVIDNPEGFYLNLHSTAFPPGAIRGQLRGQLD